MRLVQYAGGGVLELNYMWLPTWLGMNSKFKRELEAKMAARIKGRPITDLDEINNEVLQYILHKYPLPGLGDYLDGLKFVTDDTRQLQNTVSVETPG